MTQTVTREERRQRRVLPWEYRAVWSLRLTGGWIEIVSASTGWKWALIALNSAADEAPIASGYAVTIRHGKSAALAAAWDVGWMVST